MKKSLILIVFVLLFSLIIIPPVFASRVEFDPLGECNIGGTVKNVNFKEAYEDPCVKDNSCPVGASFPKRSARYILTVNIDSINCTPGEPGNPNTYESQFKLDEGNYITLDTLILKEDDQVQQGDRISGTVKYITGEHNFTSYKIEKATENINSDNVNRKRAVGYTNTILYFISVVIVVALLVTARIFYKK